MSRPRLSAPITLRELAVQMGLVPRASALRRLRRQLLSRQRYLARHGHEVTLVHVDHPKKAATVTLAQLRAHMPELFDSRDEIVAAVRASQDEIREAVDELRARTELLAQRLLRLEGGATRSHPRPAERA